MDIACIKVSFSNRTGKGVRAKITYVENAWKTVNDWTNETGHGVKEIDPHGYDEYLRKLCKYYFVIYDVMVS